MMSHEKLQAAHKKQDNQTRSALPYNLRAALGT